ncbi:4-keto-6-deoxy-N-Acetyl-D-hexosaminyl-(Lipid carrier) aminotransferase [Cronobacter turicensis 564]|nr:4-keto-6-deoxy-N-Acetyl-D-hexosaminyl-(Lipid carrier) aminotransferase [Cronobacter turicensis 564]
MQSAMSSGKLCGDGGFTRRCQQWMEHRFGSPKVLLTPSCTASLEMAALLLNIQPGDEVKTPKNPQKPPPPPPPPPPRF